MASLPNQVNVLSEMERYGREYQWAGTEEIRTLCPWHEDHGPSCYINVEKQLSYCQVCGGKSDFVGFLSAWVKRPRNIVWLDLSQRYDIGTEASVDPDVIERWHADIWNVGPFLRELRARGVTDQMLMQYRIGCDNERVTIPIRNAQGAVVNVRRYMPGAPPHEKFKNLKGRGNIPRLYPIEQLRYEGIVLCGGEIKAIVAAAQLNPHGVGAIATTIGEGNWDESLTHYFANKRVWVCYDVDDTGEKSAPKVARYLHGIAHWVGIVKLPLDREQYPTGDVNDFIARERGELKPLLDACPPWEPPAVGNRWEPVGDVLDVNVVGAYCADNTERRIRVQATIAAVSNETYPLPGRVQPQCDRGQECCPQCPVFIRKDFTHDIALEDPCLLEVPNAPKSDQRAVLMRVIGIPPQCRSVQFDVLKYYQADEVRVSPVLEILDRGAERTMQRALCVREGIQLNENYALVGRQFPHPKDQAATLLVSNYEPIGDALSHYHSNGQRDTLARFRPKAWTHDDVRDKLSEVYDDLERNVTRVFQRRRLHMAMDFAWHSPLFMTFNGRVEKAYVEVLIVGDSAQGKSETAKRLLDHYGVGTKVECKNATTAGLLGGLAKIGGQWFVSWGHIPTHDKRLVILEELKGASVEVIARLTEMRSSGIAELPKIERRKTRARTRLIALSNPRSDRPISSYSFGIEAVRELIGAPEDVRRFDACFVVSKEEVDAEVVNRPISAWPAVPHDHDGASCRELILWAWTRGEGQVVFSPEAEAEVLRRSVNMSERFSNEIPVVDTASMRLKMARLSASLAARTYSTLDGDYDTLLVRPCHVEVVHDFLVKAYSSSSFGYDDFTKAVNATRTMADPDTVIAQLRSLPHARDFCENMLRVPRFNQQDVRDWSGTDRIEADSIMGVLVRKRAITRDGQSYVKTPDFIEQLKRLLESGGLPDVPAHLKQKERF